MKTYLFKYVLALLALTALSGGALAQSTPAHQAPGREAETKALLASVGHAIDKQQDGLEASIRDAGARAHWKDEDRASFFQSVLRSKTNQEFDRQIASITAELRSMLDASQRGQVNGAAADARFVARVRELVGRLKSVHARQSAYLIEQLRAVKPRAQP